MVRSRSPEECEDSSPMAEYAPQQYNIKRRNGVSNESIKDDDAASYVKKVLYCLRP